MKYKIEYLRREFYCITNKKIKSGDLLLYSIIRYQRHDNDNDTVNEGGEDMLIKISTKQTNKEHHHHHCYYLLLPNYSTIY